VANIILCRALILPNAPGSSELKNPLRANVRTRIATTIMAATAIKVLLAVLFLGLGPKRPLGSDMGCAVDNNPFQYRGYQLSARLSTSYLTSIQMASRDGIIMM